MQMMPPGAPLFSDVTLAMISWKAHATVRHTLASYQAADILSLFGDRRIHFNEMSEADREIADHYGFAHSGTPGNVGIFGAVDAVAQGVRTPFILSLENDCPLVTDRAGFIDMLGRAMADMRALDVPVFLMRSRREPGEPFWRRSKYESKFQVVWPLGSDAGERRPIPHTVVRTYEDVRRRALRGSAIYAEEDPTLRHPSVIKKSANGNWLTNSGCLSWSNCCFLARTDFLRDVVLDRVRRFPAPSTLNGHQDIEAALKARGWWRQQGFAMGQSEPGPFTHQRLDR